MSGDRPVLMDVNTRPAGGLHQLSLCGINAPWAAVQLALGEDPGELVPPFLGQDYTVVSAPRPLRPVTLPQQRVPETEPLPQQRVPEPEPLPQQRIPESERLPEPGPLPQLRAPEPLLPAVPAPTPDPDHVDRPDRPDRPDHADRPGRVDRKATSGARTTPQPVWTNHGTAS
jgi:hypothetical protein